MEAQQIYDRVVSHLRKQGRVSVSRIGVTEVCAYRGSGGLMCAAGVLIPDEVYDPSMEGMRIDGVLESWEEELPSWLRTHLSLVVSLQKVHDDSYKRGWHIVESRLPVVAAQHDLVYTPLQKEG